MRLIENDDYERLQSKPLNVKKVLEDALEKPYSKPLNVQKVNEGFFQKSNQNATELLEAKDIPDDIKLQLYGSLMSVVKTQLHEILNKPINVNFSVSNKLENGGSLDSTIGSSSAEFGTPGSSPEKLQSTTGKVTEPDFNDFRIISPIPMLFKEKAFQLLRILKQCHEFISWDETGRVTFFENEFVPDSNLTDLINFSVRDIKFNQPPVGINRFLRVLKIVNVPYNLLSKEAKKGFLGSVDQIPIRGGESSRVSDFQHWDPIRSVDRHSTPTTKTPNANVTTRRRRNKKSNV